MKKTIIIVQCHKYLDDNEWRALYNTLLKMGEGGLLLLPENCEYMDTIEVDE